MSCQNRNAYRAARKWSPSRRSPGANRLLISALVVVGCVTLSGCVANSPTADPSSPTASASPTESVDPAQSGTELVDPLVDLKNPDSTDYVEGEISPLIHEQGTGPTKFEIERPDALTNALKFFVSCEPSNTFTVTTSTFYSGQCSTRFSSSGSIPLSPADGPLTVSIDVPEDVAFWLVAIPVQ